MLHLKKKKRSRRKKRRQCKSAGTEEQFLMLSRGSYTTAQALLQKRKLRHRRDETLELHKQKNGKAGTLT